MIAHPYLQDGQLLVDYTLEEIRAKADIKFLGFAISQCWPSGERVLSIKERTLWRRSSIDFELFAGLGIFCNTLIACRDERVQVTSPGLIFQSFCTPFD